MKKKFSLIILSICTGGSASYVEVFDDVLMFDPKTSDWKKIGSMMKARDIYAASLVNMVDVVNYCKN